MSSVFGAEVAQWVANVTARTSQTIKASVVDLCTAVIDQTPVYKENDYWGPPDARITKENWQTLVNVSADEYMLGVPGQSKATLDAVVEVAWNPWDGDSLVFANTDPYITMLEFGQYKYKHPVNTINGFSTQAPQGMVRINVARFNAILDANIAKFIGK